MLFQNLEIPKRHDLESLLKWRNIAPKVAFSVCVIAFSFAVNACRSSQKADLRNVVPADAIVYLETNDLAKTLEAVVQSKSFQENAAAIPSFAALADVQVAIAVTSFETSENQISDESSVLNFTPRFVAVAETHAWEWQTRSLVENQLDKFIRKNYGTDALLETADKNAGKLFSWTAKDNRRVFAFVKSSRIYFGNDLKAIENCLVRQSRAQENTASLETFADSYKNNAENDLAFGYVSPAGIKQIASLAGISVAAETAEEANAKSFIARVLPQILQNTTKEIVWTARQTERGIEDDYKFILKPEISAVTVETLKTIALDKNSADLLPPEFYTATRYDLKNPLVAWRAALVVTAKNSDAQSADLLMRFSNNLLEPYLIADAEKFLSSIESEIITAQFDAEGEKSIAIATIKNAEELKNSITKEINFQTAPSLQNKAQIWFSNGKETAAAIIENNFLIGDSEVVLKCLAARQSGINFTKSSNFKRFSESQAAAVTVAKDTDTTAAIVKLLSAPKNENIKAPIFYSTETRFTDKGIERKTISDFGLIGTILKQLND